jgi:hypothetical protein
MEFSLSFPDAASRPARRRVPGGGPAVVRRTLLAAPGLAALGLLLCAPRIAGAQNSQPGHPDALADHVRMMAGVRDARYCEIVVIRLAGLKAVASVYNTLGLDTCDPATWKRITAAEVKRTLGGADVVLNGPRHFVMDQIGSGAPEPGAVVTVEGMAFRKQAEIVIHLDQRGLPPYTEQKIERTTTYVFEAGKPIFVLAAPNGRSYVMQSYSNILDPTLAYADLPRLGQRLKLPPGWSYKMRTPPKDLVLTVQGVAVVLQDSLGDTYQKFNA